MNQQAAISAASSVVTDGVSSLWHAVSGIMPIGLGMDVWATAIMIGSIMAMSEPEEVEDMRGWSLKQWGKRIKHEVQAQKPEPIAGLPAPVPGMPRIEGPPQAPPPIEPPSPPPPPMSHGDMELIPAPPEGLPPALHEAWIQARTRGGEYVRGLGNQMSDDVTKIVAETWEGDELVGPVDEEERLRQMRTIRELTGQAIEEGWTPEKLASRLGNATERWGRDWERVAVTEMRGAMSEGTLITAVRTWGKDARVARVPESNACENCRRLFIDGSGKPRIFSAEELVANGTNVGKKQDAWLPTLWPIHPRCVCGTETVPPGFEFDDAWNLVAIRTESRQELTP